MDFVLKGVVVYLVMIVLAEDIGLYVEEWDVVWGILILILLRVSAQKVANVVLTIYVS